MKTQIIYRQIPFALAAFYYHGQQLKEARIWVDKRRQVQPGDQRLVGLDQALGSR